MHLENGKIKIKCAIEAIFGLRYQF